LVLVVLVQLLLLLLEHREAILFFQPLLLLVGVAVEQTLAPELRLRLAVLVVALVETLAVRNFWVPLEQQIRVTLVVRIKAVETL
jgi:hypothetical protein